MNKKIVQCVCCGMPGKRTGMTQIGHRQGWACKGCLKKAKARQGIRQATLNMTDTETRKTV
jgi:hypothetical protein